MLSLHSIKNGAIALNYTDIDFKLWHRKEHTNLVKEKEETNTVSESAWLLQTVVKFFPAVEQRVVRNYLFLLKEDIRDNDCIIKNIKGVNSLELTPFFCAYILYNPDI